ncbi:MAG: CYTH domain-containing protein [Clostridia bacterium]|nr:CYTH domain-containing protein [Clostridia bacterium]
MEIERKFLVKNKEKVKQLIEEYRDTKKSITQDYIYSDKLTAIRKRKIEKNSQVKYIYTVKTGRKGLSVNEFEEEISEDLYNSLELNPNRISIIKDRYVIPYVEGLKIELDVFHGNYEGVVFAEIEFKSEDQAKSIHMPDWFYKEITDEVTNDKMSKGEFKYMDGLML